MPAFLVTLPGQVNPFRYINLVTHAGLYMGELSLLDEGQIENGQGAYYPVTILESGLANNSLNGIVRNGFSWPLYDVRVVAFANTCGWREQTLETTTLQAGEEAPFNGAYYCLIEDLNLVGHGKTTP
jgi:hypothetical protein